MSKFADVGRFTLGIILDACGLINHFYSRRTNGVNIQTVLSKDYETANFDYY